MPELHQRVLCQAGREFQHPHQGTVRAVDRLLQDTPMQKDTLLPRQIRRFKKSQRVELNELQPAGNLLHEESRMGSGRAHPQGDGAASVGQIPAVGRGWSRLSRTNTCCGA